MPTTPNKISELQDRVSSKTRKTYNKLTEGLNGHKKEYELVFTVRKHHLRH